MKKEFLIVFLFLSFFFVFPHKTKAARQRTRKPKKELTYTARGVVSRVKFRPDRLGLLLNFSNFQNLQSGRYELIYDTNGVTQGAGGSIILGDSSTKELLFGTCSGNVCNFHENISNARLSIVSTLKDGTVILKPYRIKV
ncbi:hypothetical protein COT75_04680 [Candidatus Beckwithbacteria bacterium CG10_big_fil_rev_8_21_14_0_10_34_10]|uniref:Uncharacterized protein n=1 Tax=Candidatus Beckwithbacteria bacterium CG10_big_fil_rev_8_21_14_0_10_34_10 TaxID=1974495 RepID=A0A2H0WA11_9BACT|nr:MAG: hypothetical protein COT75_04680 [Candidatus Beckwithbacteria bacterium CG10_big_fil_rev_8_21_14_0_10_34_10]